MNKDLFQSDFALSYADRSEIVENLKKLGGGTIYCSACGSGVDIVFMRRKHNEPLKHAMCLPCFLQNHTDTDQDDIDRIVKIGESRGWYSD